MISAVANRIFEEVIKSYHEHNDIDFVFENPYPKDSIEHLLYLKCWIDTAQWHMEDEVRRPDIEPIDGLAWKRRIDKQNQDRTDMVEFVDGYFLEQFKDVQPADDAKINTESPAWAIDRLSILALKIYHMREEVLRADGSATHKESCQAKLAILLAQRYDLSLAIDELLTDIAAGRKYMKVYKQMKMYNDPSLNPVLYKK